MTFSPQEKAKAASLTSINIGSVGNFQGVIGSVVDSTIHIDNVRATDEALSKHGFSEEQRIEIQTLIAEFKAASPEGKVGLAKRGIAWVVSNAEKLGQLAAIFRDFFGRQ